MKTQLQSRKGLRSAVKATTATCLSGMLAVSLFANAFAATGEQLIQAAQQAIDMENYAEAATLYSQAVQAAQGGKDAQTEMIARGGYAEALVGQGDFAGAAKQFKPVIAGAPKILGDSPALARIYDAYAWLMLGQGKNDQATSYCQMAMAIRQKVAPNSASLAESYESMGAIQELEGLLDPAAASFTEALKIRQALGVDQAISVANLEERLAMIDMRRGKVQEAQRLFNDSLQHKSATGAVSQQYIPHPWTQTVMYRFANGAPYCGRTTTGAAAIQTANNVLVEAMWDPSQDVGKAARVKIRITNHSDGPIDVMPRPAMLVVLTPQIKIASPLNTEELARSIEKKGDRKAGLIRFFGGNADTTVQSTIVQSPGWGGYRNNWGWGYGGYGMPYYNNKTQTTTITSFVPDYEARARAEARAQDVQANARRAADSVRSQAVNHATLPPGEVLEGALQFDAGKVQSALLKLPIGNAIFEFPIGPGQ